MEYLAMQPLVSVIVPVYNMEKYLARCLDSIVGQTYKNLEILLINDGSTDRSGEICRQYAQTDPRICLFEQENQGLSAARNTGLDHMRGQYIVFVDSDDYVSPYLVEILLDKMLEYNVPIAVCNYLEVGDSDDSAILDTVPMGQANFSQKMSRDEVFDTIGTDRWLRFLLAHCKMYDRRIFKTLRYPYGKIYEDGYVVYNVYIQAENVCYVDLKLYAYRQSLNSITRKNGVHHIEHIEIAIDSHLTQIALFQQYGVQKYSLRLRKGLLPLADEICSVVGKERAKQYIKEIEKKTYLFTGKKLFDIRWVLFKISPKLYRFTRKPYLKIKQLLKH